jgi:hypothetical protein
MIPHHPGDIEERAFQDSLSQLGPRHPSDAVNRVTAETTLFGKEPAAIERITWEKIRSGLIRSEERRIWTANANKETQGEEYES